MPLSEADTRAKVNGPALHGCAWTQDLIKREEAAPSVVPQAGHGGLGDGRVDYLQRAKARADTQPAAVALIETKGRPGLAGTVW